MVGGQGQGIDSALRTPTPPLPSPLPAAQNASERQQKALEAALVLRSRKRQQQEAEGGGAAPAPPPPPPEAGEGDGAGPSEPRELDPAEKLMVKCRPLSEQWGTERFGFADVVVLKAIEVRRRRVRLAVVFCCGWVGRGAPHSSPVSSLALLALTRAPRASPPPPPTPTLVRRGCLAPTTAGTTTLWRSVMGGTPRRDAWRASCRRTASWRAG